jgi:hypothetical protein
VPAAPQGTTAVPTTLQQTLVDLPMIVAAAGAGLVAVRRYR